MSMVEMKVSELTGAALDYAVAIATSEPFSLDQEFGAPTGVIRVADGSARLWRPSTDWSQGGPLIEELIGLTSQGGGSSEPFYAETGCGNIDGYATGATPLIAACRAIVAAKLGETVQIPSELAEVQS